MALFASPKNITTNITLIFKVKQERHERAAK